MVVDLGEREAEEQQADRLFQALSDATRRDIVRKAVSGEHSVSALARMYPMSFAAVQKHVAVLEQAGLVVKERHGREQRVRTDVSALRTAHLLLDQIAELWQARIERLGDELAESPKGAS
jgi:DNA-binding transcriptional ArsR family regulator